MLQNGLKILKNNLDKRQFKIAEHILKEINERLTFLLNVGLRLFNFIKRVWNFIWW